MPSDSEWANALEIRPGPRGESTATLDSPALPEKTHCTDGGSKTAFNRMLEPEPESTGCTGGRPLHEPRRKVMASNSSDFVAETLRHTAGPSVKT